MGNANTLGKNDVSLLWLLKNSKTVYRSVLAQALEDKSPDAIQTGIDALAYFTALKNQIVDGDTELRGDMDDLEQTLQGVLIAESAFGTFIEDVKGNYATNAALATQTNTLTNKIDSDLGNYEEFIKGQICRGYITNPDYGVIPGAPQYLYGILISSQTSVTANTKDDFGDGNVYYEIDEQSDPTFGFYTSEGWQFWVGGNRVGWYNSSDGKLHTVQQEVERDMQMGDWLITDSNGFGIKYIGG